MARDHRLIHCLENDKYYESCEDAGRELGINYLTIWNRLKIRSTRPVAGYTFKYERKPTVKKETKKK